MNRLGTRTFAIASKNRFSMRVPGLGIFSEKSFYQADNI
jgi:hypothetical protein